MPTKNKPTQKPTPLEKVQALSALIEKSTTQLMDAYTQAIGQLERSKEKYVTQYSGFKKKVNIAKEKAQKIKTQLKEKSTQARKLQLEKANERVVVLKEQMTSVKIDLDQLKAELTLVALGQKKTLASHKAMAKFDQEWVKSLMKKPTKKDQSKPAPSKSTSTQQVPEQASANQSTKEGAPIADTA